MREAPRIAILGAGPAGLGAAWRLAAEDRARVTVLERNPVVGGNAGSFELEGVRVDYGSHRLHPSCDARVMNDIRSLLGTDLLDRPRHGRIRLQKRWIHFPLKPLDLALRLPPSFGARVIRDIASKPFRKNGGSSDSFSAALRASLGPTIAEDFYIPYARKIWGVDPDALDPVQAKRRVSANSPGKLVKKVLGSIPGLKPPGAGRFFYPRGGFGRISEAYAQAATEAGAELRMQANVQELRCVAQGGFEIAYAFDGKDHTLACERVWSTIPISVLAKIARPAPSADVLAACDGIEFRAMLLVYLVLPQDRFTEYDAHYFPEPEVAVTRISEPKNYSDTELPHGHTVLCAELPCTVGGKEWNAEAAELGELVASALGNAGLPLRAAPVQVHVRRLPQAYPIYKKGYDQAFGRLDAWAQSVPGLLSFGRQGLFAHDNTHHALFMAYCAADCVTPEGGFDQESWAGYRRVFETHVVED